jgi:hypothetical protein
MSFYDEVLAGALANVLAGVFIVLLYVLIQWFLRATDIVIGNVWRFDGSLDQPQNLRPSFDIRNRSGSRNYLLANVAYFKDKRPIAAFDNKSLWGKELRPGTITFVEAAPVRAFGSVADCLQAEVHVRLQNGHIFWLKGNGPGQQRMGLVQRNAFWLRDKMEKRAVPME